MQRGSAREKRPPFAMYGWNNDQLNYWQNKETFNVRASHEATAVSCFAPDSNPPPASPYDCAGTSLFPLCLFEGEPTRGPGPPKQAVTSDSGESAYLFLMLRKHAERGK
jgi:hypothetical protein